MTEIVVDIISVSILYTEVLIPLGQRMILWDMSDHMNTFCYLAGMVYQDESVFAYLWPFRRNAM